MYKHKNTKIIITLLIGFFINLLNANALINNFDEINEDFELQEELECYQKLNKQKQNGTEVLKKSDSFQKHQSMQKLEEKKNSNANEEYKKDEKNDTFILKRTEEENAKVDSAEEKKYTKKEWQDFMQEESSKYKENAFEFTLGAGLSLVNNVSTAYNINKTNELALVGNFNIAPTIFAQAVISPLKNFIIKATTFTDIQFNTFNFITPSLSRSPVFINADKKMQQISASQKITLGYNLGWFRDGQRISFIPYFGAQFLLQEDFSKTKLFHAGPVIGAEIKVISKNKKHFFSTSADFGFNIITELNQIPHFNNIYGKSLSFGAEFNYKYAITKNILIGWMVSDHLNVSLSNESKNIAAFAAELEKLKNFTNNILSTPQSVVDFLKQQLNYFSSKKNMMFKEEIYVLNNNITSLLNLITTTKAKTVISTNDVSKIETLVSQLVTDVKNAILKSNTDITLFTKEMAAKETELKNFINELNSAQSVPTVFDNIFNRVTVSATLTFCF